MLIWEGCLIKTNISYTAWIKETLGDMICVTIGCVLVALGLYTFSIKADFAPMGLGGFALVIHHFTGLPTGLLTVLLNIPLIPLSWAALGRGFVLRSGAIMLLDSLMIDWLMPLFPAYEGPALWSAVFCGFCLGSGQALMYLRGASGGGIDFLTLPIRKWLPHFSIGQLNLLIELVIIAMSGVVFGGFDAMLCTILCMGTCTVVLDHILAGSTEGRTVLVVSDRGQQICDAIASGLVRGATRLQAIGGGTGNEKDVVLYFCSAQEVPQLRAIVVQVDPSAILATLNAGEVRGRGFPTSRIPGSAVQIDGSNRQTFPSHRPHFFNKGAFDHG